MLSRIQVLMLSGVTVLLTVIILVIFTQQQEKKFTEFQVESKAKLLASASLAVSAHVAYQRKNLDLFVAENYPLLFQLRINPQHSGAYAVLKSRVAEKFPDQSNFTIIDERGQPVWMDIESEVGPVCKTEIEHFSKEASHAGSSARNKILIHPNVNQYHYDLMAIIPMASNMKNLFLVSILPDTIAGILEKHEIPGHQLMLVKKGDSPLIEITTEGSRDKLSREIRLSREELNSLKTFSDVDGTDWRLVDLPVKDFQKNYRVKLWKDSTIIALLCLTIGLALIVVINRALSRK